MGHHYMNNNILLVLLFVLTFSQVYATSSSSTSDSQSWVVNTLPGFSGNLPFKFHTGYIGVGRQEVQLFYYFVESEHDPGSDPLMIWLTGGPGCASLSTFFHEYLGPLSLNLTGSYFNFTTSTWETDLPPLQFNPYSWTKFASILFVDSPVGTGYSYATTAKSYYTDDVAAAQDILEFLKKWFMVHPQFATNPFYVGACSYTGIVAPIVTQGIVKGNEEELGSQIINIKGYVLGSPLTDPQNDGKIGKSEFIYRVSLISDELYEQSKVNCGDSYKNESSLECEKDVEYASYLVESLFGKHILETNKKGSNPNHRCPDYDKRILDNWMNNVQVREALHVREGTVGKSTRCNRIVKTRTYNQTILSSVGYHQYLSKKPLRALIYTGDQDLIVPYASTLRWIKRLNAQISDYWRPWFFDDQVAGYVTEYSNGHYNLTFTTIKGAGHCASTYNPRESYTMFQRWLADNPL